MADGDHDVHIVELDNGPRLYRVVCRTCPWRSEPVTNDAARYIRAQHIVMRQRQTAECKAFMTAPWPQSDAYWAIVV